MLVSFFHMVVIVVLFGNNGAHAMECCFTAYIKFSRCIKIELKISRHFGG